MPQVPERLRLSRGACTLPGALWLQSVSGIPVSAPLGQTALFSVCLTGEQEKSWHGLPLPGVWGGHTSALTRDPGPPFPSGTLARFEGEFQQDSCRDRFTGSLSGPEAHLREGEVIPVGDTIALLLLLASGTEESRLRVFRSWPHPGCRARLLDPEFTTRLRCGLYQSMVSPGLGELGPGTTLVPAPLLHQGVQLQGG